jgi:hypothetical protein
MNRTQRAKIRAAKANLDMLRGFKNEALESYLGATIFQKEKKKKAFKTEKEYFSDNAKGIRRLKKGNVAASIFTNLEVAEI